MEFWSENCVKVMESHGIMEGKKCKNPDTLLAIKAKIQCQVTRRDWRFENHYFLIELVNTTSPDRLVRSSLNLVSVFPTMSTGTLLFLVQIQGLFGSKLKKKCDFVKF